MNDENLRKLYQRLGIAEPPPAPAPRPLPAPSPVAVAPPPEIPSPVVASPPQAPEPAPTAMHRLSETRVTLSLPVLVLAVGAIVLGLLLVSRNSGETPPPPPGPTAKVVEPPTPPLPPAPPPPPEPMTPEPVVPIQPPAPTPAPPPDPDPPKPPEPSPAERFTARSRVNGSTEESESAVGKALDWITRHQASTGEWEAMHFDRRCPRSNSCQVQNATGDPLYTPGVTGLALLAYMAAGHSPSEGPHAKTLSLGLAWLVEKQDADGGIKHDKRVLLYNHAVATRALCEAARLTGDTRYRVAAQKALEWLASSQGADGGWNYYVDPSEPERNDASITGWVALAIRAAEEAKVKVPDDMKGRVRSFFVRRTVISTGEVIYSDRDPGSGRRGGGLVGLGLFVRGWMGDDDPDLTQRAVSRLMATKPDWNLFQAAQERTSRREYPFSPDQNFAAWYYGTEAMFRRGGEDWKTWNEALREALVRNQVRDGHASGSWEPEFSYIGREGGRVFSTSIAVLILTIYARER